MDLFTSFHLSSFSSSLFFFILSLLLSWSFSLLFHPVSSLVLLILSSCLLSSLLSIFSCLVSSLPFHLLLSSCLSSHMSLHMSCFFSCLFSSLLFHLLVSPFSSSRFFSFIVSSSLFLSCLLFSFLVLSRLSFSVSLCLSLSLSVSLCFCLSLSLCLSVCVVWCVWCPRVYVQKRLRVYVQNVPVCTGTTPACVTTCGRGAGTHGGVLNVHTGTFWMDLRGAGVIGSSAYQNLPTYGHHVPQRSPIIRFT